MTPSITVSEYQHHENASDGFCPACGEWSTGGVEPDAEEYTCPHCDEPTLVGAMTALMEGHITIEED